MLVEGDVMREEFRRIFIDSGELFMDTAWLLPMTAGGVTAVLSGFCFSALTTEVLLFGSIEPRRNAAA